MLELNKIYCEDCIETMARMPDKFVDLVLTDPPYGVGKEFENDNLEENELKILWEKWFKECYRILIDNGNLLVEIPKNKLDLFSCFKDYKYEYAIVLYTTNAMRRGKMGFNNYSLCLWFSKNGGKIKNRYKDLISANLVNNINLFRHPSPKIAEHYRTLIYMFEPNLTYDPFIGSGTTAIACEIEGRQWIGSEISKKYVDIANKRIRAKQNQMRLAI